MDGDEEEALAIGALLDDYGDLETLEWLPLLDEAVATTVGDSEASRLAFSDCKQHGATASNSPPEGTNGNAREKRRRDPNRARNARRLELLHLRMQVSKLKSHLDVVRHAEQRHSSQVGGRLQPIGRSWEEEAKQQWDQRQVAETENTRMRLLIEDNLKMTTKIRGILQPKRPRHALWGELLTREPTDCHGGVVMDVPGVSNSPLTSASASPAIPFGEPLVQSDEQIFAVLTRCLARARNNVDALFAANGLAATEKAYRSAKVEQDEVNGTVMELVASKVLPYAMEATKTAAWHHFGDLVSQMPDRSFFEYRDERRSIPFDEESNMQADSYSIELGNGFVSAKFDEWRVIRQFEDHDRVIIIYCLLTEATEFASEPVSGIRILEETYVVLRRPSGSPTSTLMQTCYRHQPFQYKFTPGLDQTAAALADFLFGFTGGRISLNYQMIERELRTSAVHER